MKAIPILFLVLLFWSCQKEEIKGSLVGYASVDFEVTKPLAVSDNSIDFKTQKTLTISASFNEAVNYQLTMTGKTSGAKQVISGLGDQLSVEWIGNAELVFFQQEKVTIELTVFGKEESVGYQEIEILEVYNPEGVQLASFESGQTTAACWFPGENMLSCETRFEVEYSLQGKYAHQVKGISLDKPGDQFVGLASIEPRFGINKKGRYFDVPTINPDSLYFNLFVYGTGDDNVAMFIKFMQDDNQNGTHESDRENGFEMQLKDFSHTGWKKFSFKYADVPLGGNTGFGGNGDGIYRPDQIVKIELGLWALKDTQKEVQFIYDYAVFTADKPFGE